MKIRFWRLRGAAARVEAIRRRAWPPARRWLGRRYPAGLALALALALAWAVFRVPEPPADAARGGRSNQATVVVIGLSDPRPRPSYDGPSWLADDRRGRPIRATVAIQAPRPGLRGCDPWVHVELRVDLNIPDHDGVLFERDLRRFAAIAGMFGPHVRRPRHPPPVSPKDRLPAAIAPPPEPDRSTRPPLPSERAETASPPDDPAAPPSWSRLRTIESRRFRHAMLTQHPAGAPEPVYFEARWVEDRGIGSCWVRIPALIGEQVQFGVVDALADSEHRARERQARRMPPGTSWRRARTALNGTGLLLGTTNQSESRPSPVSASTSTSAWVCEVPADLADCSAWAAVDAPWRRTFRDVALLLIGVLISIAVELWWRAQGH